MRQVKLVAILMISVMLCVVSQPAFAWSGGGYVKEKAKDFGKVGEVISGTIEVYDKGSKLYNASNNSERVDIVIDAAKEYGKDIVKAPVKIAADATITASAVPTAIYIASAVGMTAKTGTAIAALSGAAATNATLCAIGTPIVTALGITAAPAVVGGAIVAGGAAAVCYGVHKLIDWIW